MSNNRNFQNKHNDFEKILRIVKSLSPDSKIRLKEYLDKEDIVKDLTIPEEQKNIVRDRITKYENIPESYLSWDEIEKRLLSDK